MGWIILIGIVWLALAGFYLILFNVNNGDDV